MSSMLMKIILPLFHHKTLKFNGIQQLSVASFDTEESHRWCHRFHRNRVEPVFNLLSSSSSTMSSRVNPVVEHETDEWSHISLHKKKDEKCYVIKLQKFEELNEKLLSQSNTVSSWASVKRKASETSPIKKMKVNELLKDEDVDIEDDWMDSDYNRKTKNEAINII
jgi:hypothetical protein